MYLQLTSCLGYGLNDPIPRNWGTFAWARMENIILWEPVKLKKVEAWIGYDQELDKVSKYVQKHETYYYDRKWYFFTGFGHS